jgi:diacylglycerol kinase family enzyme
LNLALDSEFLELLRSERPSSPAVESARRWPAWSSGEFTGARTAPARPMAVLVNPRAGTMQMTLKECTRLQDLLGAWCWNQTGSSDEEFQEVVERWAHMDIRSLAILGGDGTVQLALSALQRWWPVHRAWPELVLLDGGTMGLLAASTGARDGWRRLLRGVEQGREASWKWYPMGRMLMNDRPLTTLCIGAPARISQAFQQEGAGNRAHVLPYTAGLLHRALRGDAEVRSLLDPISVQVRQHGELIWDGPISMLYLTSFAPVARLWRTDAEQTAGMHLVIVPWSQSHPVSLFSKLFADRSRSDRRASRVWSSDALTFRFERQVPLMYDGELATLGPVLDVQLQSTLGVWVPAGIL